MYTSKINVWACSFSMYFYECYYLVEKQLQGEMTESAEKDQQIKAALRAAEDAKFELSKGQKDVNEMKKHLSEQMETFRGEMEKAQQRYEDLQQRLSELQKSSLDQGERLLEKSHEQMEADDMEKRRILQV